MADDGVRRGGQIAAPALGVRLRVRHLEEVSARVEALSSGGLCRRADESGALIEARHAALEVGVLEEGAQHDARAAAEFDHVVAARKVREVARHQGAEVVVLGTVLKPRGEALGGGIVDRVAHLVGVLRADVAPHFGKPRLVKVLPLALEAPPLTQKLGVRFGEEVYARGLGDLVVRPRLRGVTAIGWCHVARGAQRPRPRGDAAQRANRQRRQHGRSDGVRHSF